MTYSIRTFAAVAAVCLALPGGAQESDEPKTCPDGAAPPCAENVDPDTNPAPREDVEVEPPVESEADVETEIEEGDEQDDGE